MPFFFEDFLSLKSEHCAVYFSCPKCGYEHRQEDGPFPMPDEVCPQCGETLDYEVLG